MDLASVPGFLKQGHTEVLKLKVDFFASSALEATDIGKSMGSPGFRVLGLHLGFVPLPKISNLPSSGPGP